MNVRHTRSSKVNYDFGPLRHIRSGCSASNVCRKPRIQVRMLEDIETRAGKSSSRSATCSAVVRQQSVQEDSRQLSNSCASTSEGTAKPELSLAAKPVCISCALFLGTGSYFTPTGLALASDFGPQSLLQEQVIPAELQSILTESASFGDLMFLPDIHLSPLSTLSFLLQNPLVTLAVAAALYYIVPRAFRALVRWLVLPLVLALVAYVIFENPSAAMGLGKGVYSCKSSSLFLFCQGHD